MRQGIEAIVDHRQRVTQVLLTAFAPGQVGKVGGDPRVVCWVIMLIEANTFDGEREIFTHFALAPLIPRLTLGSHSLAAAKIPD